MADDLSKQLGVANSRTAVHASVSDVLGTSHQAPEARQAFLAAYEHLAALARAHANPAMLVAAVDGQGQLVDVARIAPRQSLIIGRHTRCGLRLEEQSISLRHMALLVLPGPPGASHRVHLWDLHTPLLFRTEDGRSNAAAIFEGAGCFFLGPYTLWLVPSEGLAGKGWPQDALQAWQERPRAEFVDGSASTRPRASRHRPRLYDSDASELSSITSVSALLPLEAAEDTGEARGYGMLHISHGTTAERRGASAESLERGLLLGRYPRCNLSMDAEGISRVHLLLVLIDDEVWVIDTASTNGVWVEQRPVRAQVLGSRGTLMLGTDVRLGWRRD